VENLVRIQEEAKRIASLSSFDMQTLVNNSSLKLGLVEEAASEPQYLRGYCVCLDGLIGDS